MGRCQGIAVATGAASLGPSAALGARELLSGGERVPPPRARRGRGALRAPNGPPHRWAVASRRPGPAGGAVGRRPGSALAAFASLAPVGRSLWWWCAAMDRNPSPPSSEAEEEEDAVGNTVYSKHWLFSILTRLIEVRARRGGGAVREEGGGPGGGRRFAGEVRLLPGPWG